MPRTTARPAATQAQGDGGSRDRILGAAFAAFLAHGYAGASTLEIATRAKVSKRDLYANFRDKHVMLLACIKGRAQRMQLSPDLPTPDSRDGLASTLKAFGASLLREVSHPTVIATFRLAIAEATRSPEVAQTLEVAGREATRRALADLLARAQSAGLIDPGAPSEMASHFLALLWEGLMVSLLLGLAERPKADEIQQRAAKATAAFLQLHPEPAAQA